MLKVIMSTPTYDKKKVRKALLLAPIAGALGIMPFIFQLNLSIGQFLTIVSIAIVMSYLFGLVLGGPGYLLLNRLGYTDSRYMIGYAVVLIILAPIVLDDIYAMVAFGPPILLAAAAFCYFRGPAVEAAA